MSNKAEVTPEILESIVGRVADKITAAFKSFVDLLVTAVIDRVDTKFTELTVRIDQLENQLRNQSYPVPHGRDATSDQQTEWSSATTSSSSATGRAAQSNAVPRHDTFQVMMAVELEKADRLKRERNVIVSGLLPDLNTTDNDLFTKFCEDNLTIKPRPVSCRRVGPKRAGVQKLKVTLGSDLAAEELTAASQLLRESDDDDVKSVFINKDMTPWKHRSLTRLGSRNARSNHSPLEVVQFLPDDDSRVTCFYLENMYFYRTA